MSTWTIDTAHTSIGFAVRHMMITTVRGHLSGAEGSIEFDPSQPEASQVTVRIPAASIDTGMEARDAHLRSADFLDADAHPYLTFTSRRLERHRDGFRIHGDLEIRGLTRPVVLEAALGGLASSMQGGRLAAFEAQTKIRRSDWKLDWNVALEAGGWLVGDEIAIQIDLEASEVSATAAAAA
jgi:polyisoprenoid-binding protein YceI